MMVPGLQRSDELARDLITADILQKVPSRSDMSTAGGDLLWL